MTRRALLLAALLVASLLCSTGESQAADREPVGVWRAGVTR